MADSTGEIWRPSPEQTLLVSAATSDGERARSAWQEWRARVEIAKIEGKEKEILPLLYRNLQRLGIEGPEVKQLGQIHRQQWAKNMIGMRDLTEIITEFQARGIDTLVLKGMAMISGYYKDAGVRALADFDLLVHGSQANQAIDLLGKLGWSNPYTHNLRADEYRTPANGIGFYHAGHQFGCDLHWHVTHLHLSDRYDAPMWKDAVPIQIGEVQTLALCREDQLIHIFFNTHMNEGRINLRWLTDTLTIFNSATSIDWERFVERCRLLEFGQPVAKILEYLRTDWQVDVTLQVIDALTELPISYSMRRAYQYLERAKADRTVMDHLWYLSTQYRHSHSHFSPNGFLRFLSYRWKVDGSFVSILNYGYQRARGVPARRAHEIVKPAPE